MVTGRSWLTSLGTFDAVGERSSAAGGCSHVRGWESCTRTRDMPLSVEGARCVRILPSSVEPKGGLPATNVERARDLRGTVDGLVSAGLSPADWEEPLWHVPRLVSRTDLELDVGLPCWAVCC